MNRFRPETHVAQQSRRDKLRVLSNADPSPAPMFSSPGGVLDFAEGSLMNSSTTSGIHDGGGWILNCVGGGVGGQMQAAAPLYPSNLYHPKPPALAGYHDVSGELSASQETQKQQYRDLHFPSSQLCHTSLQDVFTSPSSTVWNQGLDAGTPWVDGGNELLLNPGGASVWMNKNSQQWSSDGYFGRMKAERGVASAVPTGVGSSTQSLSLSLSSNPLPELQAAQFEERFRQEVLAGQENSRAGTVVGFSGQSTVGSSTPDPRRCAGPLGPFTGYAAILKSSRFMKPAQLLLDEFCSVAMGSKGKQRDGPPRSSGAVSGKCDAAVGESGSNGRGGNSVVSSTSIYSSAEGGGEGGASSGAPSSQIHHPEFQQKKAKLLCLQEEVFRRYKQYYQQMQMVISSFETVAGLSAAAPFTSMALKAVSKHFRCLKNAITDQLRHVSKLLGEELISSPSSSKGETTPSLNYIDHGMRKRAVTENSLNFLDHGQPVWRPQRGLPERAVAVLRAWLFDHFLHPYPTDTDKHMLATQTGLSRNQVSNWFINARVRLWKPMVEEIHMLETKGMSGMDLNSSNRNDGKLAANEEGQRSSDQVSEARSGKTVDCSPMEQMLDEESSRAIGQWHREKRTRMEECGIPAAMDGSLMSFASYQGGMDMGSLGAVSLTLGLRQGEGAQQQQHQQMRRHFASHMVHDFVG